MIVKYKLLKDIPYAKKDSIWQKGLDNEDNQDRLYSTNDDSAIMKAISIFDIDNFDEWFSKLEPLFYTEDFKDGSFPKKSCSNCANNDTIFTDKQECSGRYCHQVGYKYWQGKLKGTPIYKSDKCWLVYFDNFINKVIMDYSYWAGDINLDSISGKYFSNEINARNYYESLQPKLEVGKWYIGNNGCNTLHYIVEIINNKVWSYGFNFKENWYNDTNNNEPSFEITGKERLANDKEVESRLLEYAKKMYPIGTKFNNAYKSTFHALNSGKVQGYSTTILDQENWKAVGIYTNNQWLLFNGEWATIIEQPKLMLGDVEVTIKSNCICTNRSNVPIEAWLEWFKQVDYLTSIPGVIEIDLKIGSYDTIIHFNSDNDNLIECIKNVKYKQLIEITKAIKDETK